MDEPEAYPAAVDALPGTMAGAGSDPAPVERAGIKIQPRAAARSRITPDTDSAVEAR